MEFMKPEFQETDLVTLVVDSLNEYLDLDREAITSLVEFRVPANDCLLNHPSVKVVLDEGPRPMVGILGILNGIIGGLPGSQTRCVTAVFDDHDKLLRFELTEFLI
jgi:hypothetical protein